MRSNRRRRIVGAAVILAVALSVSLAAIGWASPAPDAHAAKRKTVPLVEHARMHLVKKKGNILRESGTTTGTLAGKVSGRFDIGDIRNPTGTVTFKPNSGGSITVTASGTPEKLGYPVSTFSGVMAVKGGSGRYDQVTGSGTFTGTVNRRTWAISVDATVKITY
jgi:hypothetical protein